MFLSSLSIVLPLLGFAAQYVQTRKDKRDSFSTHVILLGIVGSVFGLAFHWLNASLSVGVFVSNLSNVAVLLALLELVTRTRREQRMLPENCFLRISFKPKSEKRKAEVF